jgi:hypothetical protein
MPRPGLVKKRRAQMTHAKLDINHEEHTHTHVSPTIMMPGVVVERMYNVSNLTLLPDSRCDDIDEMTPSPHLPSGCIFVYQGRIGLGCRRCNPTVGTLCIGSRGGRGEGARLCCGG